MQRRALGLALLLALTGLLAAGAACSSFGASDSPGAADAASADALAPDAGLASPDARVADSGSVDSGGCLGTKAALCIDFDEPDPTTAFVNGTAASALPEVETSAGATGELDGTMALSPPRAFFASSGPPTPSATFARLRKPTYVVGPISGHSILRAEFDWFLATALTGSKNAVFFELGFGMSGGTCRVALVLDDAGPGLKLVCPGYVDYKPVNLPVRDQWSHVVMELTVSGPATGTVEIAGTTVHTASGTAPTSPGDLFLAFGLETNDSLTAPMSVGFDNIVVTLK